MANLFDPNDPKTWPEYNKGPTSAFTVPGQKSTGLRKLTLAEQMARAQIEAQPRTSITNAGGNFNLRGMQTPYENYDISPGNVAQTAATVMGPSALKTAINSTYLLGKTVLHGSPQQGLKQIDPRLGSARFPDDEIAYAWNPAWNRKMGPDWVADAAKEYMGNTRTGSLYVGKIPRNAILEDPDPSMNHMILGGKPIRVKEEFPQIPPPPGANTHSWIRANDEGMKQAMLEYLRRRGLGPTPKNPIPPAVGKLKDFFRLNGKEIPDSVV